MKESLQVNDKENIKEIFNFMIDQGVIYSISILLHKLISDVQNGLLSDLLWLLEDFAAGDKEEVKTLLQQNIVGRVIAIM